MAHKEMSRTNGNVILISKDVSSITLSSYDPEKACAIEPEKDTPMRVVIIVRMDIRVIIVEANSEAFRFSPAFLPVLLPSLIFPL
jgi:hypothetical protein